MKKKKDKLMERRPLLSLKHPVVVKPDPGKWIIIAPSEKKVQKNKAPQKPFKKPFKRKVKKENVDDTKKMPGKKTMLKWLYETFPKTFMKKKSPLKIAIHKDIFALFPVYFGEITGINRKRARENLKNAICFYCNSIGYHLSMKKNTHRIDLEGNLAEEILVEHKEHSQKIAAKLQARKDKKKLLEEQEKAKAVKEPHVIS